MKVKDPAARARARRQRASRRFRPGKIELLLVAEAPPKSLDRYFYFAEVREQDSLFRYVARELLDVAPTRDNKAALLGQLKEHGVFLIDLSPDPLDGQSLSGFVPNLVRRCKAMSVAKVILIKATVYDAAFKAMRDAGLLVVDERIPFPGSGRQRQFQEAFARALGKAPSKAPAPRRGAASARASATPDAEGSVTLAITLHEEIAAILRKHGHGWMSTTEIADEVNRRGKYRKGDGSPMTAFQVHGRTKNYIRLFERHGSMVRLVAAAAG
jgi:hypothetical protein